VPEVSRGQAALAKTSEGKAAEVEGLIAASLSALGFDIVRVQLSGERRAKLQIMAERLNGAGMTIEDCAEVSRAVAAILDVTDPIHQSYVLEVSSPGIDRPLTRLGDFERFAGFEAKVEMRMPIDGARRFRGRLKGVEGTSLLLDTDGGEIRLSFAELVKAKLVLTEDLIAAHQRTEGS